MQTVQWIFHAKGAKSSGLQKFKASAFPNRRHCAVRQGVQKATCPSTDQPLGRGKRTASSVHCVECLDVLSALAHPRVCTWTLELSLLTNNEIFTAQFRLSVLRSWLPTNSVDCAKCENNSMPANGHLPPPSPASNSARVGQLQFAQFPLGALFALAAV